MLSTVLISGLVVLSTISLALYQSGQRKRAELGNASEKLNAVESELSSLRGRYNELQKESRLLASFIRESPHIAATLGNVDDPRELPGLLLHASLRFFNPWQAVVLLRRHRSQTEPSRDHHLVVAAVARSGQGIELGQEIRFGKGLIGDAAETQQACSKQDAGRDAAPAGNRHDPNDPLMKFGADLVAPMVFRGETVGVIALSETGSVSDATKGILRVICQLGASAVYNASARSKMKATAQLDGLTRLYDRTHITLILSENIFDAEVQQAPLSIFVLDVDDFRSYVDAHGQKAGDRLLMELSRLVQENVRRSDYVGRFGLEELLLVLPNTNKQQAGVVAKKLREKIANYTFPFAKNQPLGCVSVSGGIASYPADGLDTTSLLQAADKALYRSKREGMNRSTLAEPRQRETHDEKNFQKL